MSDRPYTRVYHELADEYPEMYDSADLAAFVRLLIAADQAWPQSARWPGYATKQEVSRLADTGLVICDGHRYRIRGMDKERTTRSNAASNAARIRWGNADGNAETMPSRAEPSKAKPSQADARDADVVLAYNIATLRNPTGWVLDRLNELARAFGEEEAAQAVGRACQEHAGDKPSVQLNAAETLLLAAQRQRQKDAEARARSRAIEEQEAARKRIENASPEELAKVEENKRRVAEMLAAAGKEMA